MVTPNAREGYASIANGGFLPKQFLNDAVDGEYIHNEEF